VLKKKRYKLPPVKNIMYGGQQERGIRPGTLPVALIAGCGRACELAEDEYINNNEKSCEIKKAILRELDKSDISYIVNGNQDFCIDNTINVCFEGVSSEALMLSKCIVEYQMVLRVHQKVIHQVMFWLQWEYQKNK